MIKGFYSAASAMVAGMKRQSVLSHNISNLDTPGFRQIMLAMDDWYESPVVTASQEILPHMDVNNLTSLGYLGLGTETSPQITDFSQGDINSTGRELDLAINGSGFFRVETPDGERYTRDGRFSRDADLNLVNVDGYFVLDENGEPITLPDTQVYISDDGSIIDQDGTTVATIGLADFTDPLTELARDGLNTFKADGGITGDNPGGISQGYLEATNSNVEALMTQMVIVGRAYEASQRIVQMEDDITGKILSYLGR